MNLIAKTETPEALYVALQEMDLPWTMEQIREGLRSRYKDIYAFVRQWEGGYSNDPDDPGGCTNKGVTIGTLAGWRGKKVTCADVKAISDTEAGLIYATNYWVPVWGNHTPVGLNLMHYDWGVNSGPGRATRYLQTIVGTHPDGVMGPMTLAGIEAYCNVHGVNTLIARLYEKRKAYYRALKTYWKFGKGWDRRNDACLKLSLQLAEEGHIELKDYDPPLIDEPALLGSLQRRLDEIEDWYERYPGGEPVIPRIN